MAMERPAWTICFFMVWILVIPGILLTHLSVAKLVPELEDLPDNIVKGFNEVFKFAYLERDAAGVKSSSATAIGECNSIDASLACPSSNFDVPTLVAQGQNMDPTTAKTEIQKAFERSLAVVKKVAHDKYFGTADLQSTADNLDKIVAELNKIPDGSMPCSAAVPTFCEIWRSSDGIVAGMASVDAAIDKFKNSKAIQDFEDRKGLLTFLHALPYFMVIALVFFSFFWLRGGVCCCCKGGTKAGCAIIPFAVFWLVAFVIYLVVLVAGFLVKYASNRIKVPVLKGEPTLKDAVNHIETTYPEFWDVVFKSFVEGLDLMYHSSFFFVACALLILCYSCCECICMPYRKDEERSAGNDIIPS